MIVLKTVLIFSQDLQVARFSLPQQALLISHPGLNDVTPLLP